jgi:hypothetical protein
LPTYYSIEVDMSVELEQVVIACKILDKGLKELSHRVSDLANRVLALERSTVRTTGGPPSTPVHTGQESGSFPRTDTDLSAKGYEFKNKGTCKGCQADIEWWQTPRGKSIPLDAGTLEPHWANCPNAGEFRK